MKTPNYERQNPNQFDEYDLMRDFRIADCFQSVVWEVGYSTNG